MNNPFRWPFIRKRSKGFTLLELMVVLGIVGILVAIAAPSFDTFIKNNRIVSYRDALATAFKFTRSEALDTQSIITICPSTDQSNCGGAWSDGWIVFSDDNQSGSRNGGERLVSTEPGNANLSVGNGSARAAVTFNAVGLNTGIAVTFGICDATATSGVDGHSIVLSATGSVTYSNVVADAGC